MGRLLKQFLSGEKGQALAIVLGLLAIGGLTIAVSLNYATTSLKGSRIVEEKTEGIYAAGAGVERALWSLGRGEEPPPQLSENISGMAVGIQKVNLGTYTMYLDGLTTLDTQYYKLRVSGNISWVEGNQYKYEITVISTVNQTMHLEQAGARIPVGYTYKSTPPPVRSDNGTAGAPSITQDSQGAYLLKWEWTGSNRPYVDYDRVFTLTFYITGTGSLGGAYAWTEGDPAVIGIVGEITGTRYKITATATRPEDGRTTAEIVAGIIITGGTTNILSWQITK